jgi:hypothetical protein
VLARVSGTFFIDVIDYIKTRDICALALMSNMRKAYRHGPHGAGPFEPMQ